jgi:hypothetical protein
MKEILVPMLKRMMSKDEQYDKLVDYIDMWVNEFNPCNINKLENGTITCAGYPNGNKDNLLCCSVYEDGKKSSVFSTNCKHHCKETGCKVKSLSCKLWYCKSALKNITGHKYAIDFITVIQHVNQTIRNEEIPVKSRCSKEENFNSDI